MTHTRSELIAMAVEDILAGKPARVEYLLESTQPKAEDWRTPSELTYIRVFTLPQIQWRLKSVPTVLYANTYRCLHAAGNTSHTMGCIVTEQAAPRSLYQGFSHTGYFKFTFEEGKNPVAEWVSV